MLREKTSLSIRADILDAAKRIVASGTADNLSSFVEMAIHEKVRRTKRAELYAAYDAAALDQDFQERMSTVGGQFEESVADGL